MTARFQDIHEEDKTETGNLIIRIIRIIIMIIITKITIITIIMGK